MPSQTTPERTRVLQDTWVIFRRHLRNAARQKIALLFGAVQPLLFLVLFGPLLSGLGSWEMLVPGLLVQLGLLSAGMAGFGIVFDARSGVLDRLRVSPAPRVSLLVGQALGSSVALAAQAVLLLAAGTALGLRAPLLGMALAFVLLIVAGVGLAAISNALALVLDDNLFAPVMTTAVVPLVLLSGALLPMSSAPAWLNAASMATPFRHMVDALRDLLTGHYLTAAVALGAAITTVFTVACVAIATRVFQRLNA
ncbi:ABC-2 type transport system permease protein [Sinosporangium album]|uniref:Transport permease protein n=1 Tax=Sinosporangium album TaxID=504805 RepID=A0A1G8DV69_9ACTN|nr:ABC transporter permease [Sinosporangium album]SDH61478.1 ABC-2 type transport system permease protein [Sinosporangium album]